MSIIEQTPPQDDQPSGVLTNQQETKNVGGLTVNYNGKEWTAEDILKKFENQDEHIRRIEQENQTLAQKALSAANLDEVVKQLQNRGNLEQETHSTNTNTEESTQSHQKGETFDVTSEVEKAIQRRFEEQTFNENVKSVDQELAKAYGENASAIYSEKLKELGYTPEEAKQLAGTKPNVFKQLFIGKQTQKPTGNPSSGSMSKLPNTDLSSPPQKHISKLSGKEAVERALSMLNTLQQN